MNMNAESLYELFVGAATLSAALFCIWIGVRKDRRAKDWTTIGLAIPFLVQFFLYTDDAFGWLSLLDLTTGRYIVRGTTMTIAILTVLRILNGSLLKLVDKLWKKAAAWTLKK